MISIEISSYTPSFKFANTLNVMEPVLQRISVSAHISAAGAGATIHDIPLTGKKKETNVILEMSYSTFVVLIVARKSQSGVEDLLTTSPQIYKGVVWMSLHLSNTLLGM